MKQNRHVILGEDVAANEQDQPQDESPTQSMGEAAYRTLADNSPDVIIRYDSECRRVYVNAAFERMVGVPRRDAVNQLAGSTNWRADFSLEEYRRRLRQVIETGENDEFMSTWLNADGSVTHYTMQLIAEKNDAGQITGVLAVGRNVHDLRQAEQELRILSEHSPDIICHFDRNYRYLYLSKSVERITGISADELLGKSLGEVMLRYSSSPRESAIERVRAGVTRAFETGDTVEDELEIPFESGCRVVNLRFVPEVDAFGRILSVLTISRDITEKWQAQRDLAHANAAILEVLDSIADDFVALDRNFNFTYVNHRAAQTLDQSRESLVGRCLLDIYPAMRGSTSHQIMLRAMNEGVGDTFESFFPDQNRWFQVHVYPKESGITVYSRDITKQKVATQERESLESQLRQAQKMDALGNLAGGIAHDFNNMLGTILGNVELALEDVAPNSAAKESLLQIRSAGRRARDLTQQILLFGRRQATQRGLTQMAPLLEECGQLLRTMLPPTVSLEYSAAPNAPSVLADRSQILQMLVNIATNAVQAIQDRRGKIEIRLERAIVSQDDARLDPEILPGDYAVICVRDTGIGMSPEVVERIFEPFFTTKPSGEGTGLGLSVAHGIILAHNGVIKVDSKMGEGTSFHIYLPAADIQTSATAISNLAERPSTGQGQRILCIDDDDSMVFLLHRMLQRRGYAVYGYTDADQAIAALRAAPSDFDALVTDYNMPGTSGLDVVRAAKEIRPDLPIALSSGYITEELKVRALAAGVKQLIDKPTDVETYCVAIERLFEKSSSVS